jgi:DnaJ-class molecular chaperone
MSKPVETEFYDLLNVKYDASEDEIKKAYLKVAQKEHPDKCTDRSPEGIQKATEKFQLINYAKKILTDSNKRAIYDRHGKKGLEEGGNGGGGGEGMNPFDIFQQMAGGMGGFGGFHQHMTNQNMKPPPTKHRLNVSLADLYNGKEFTFSVNQLVRCQTCKGVGAVNPDAIKRCSGCNGKGQTVRLLQVGPGMMQQIVQPCQNCQGKGKHIPNKSDLCSSCKGERVKRVDKQHTVYVKPGMNYGMGFHLVNKGDEHPETDQIGDLDVVLTEISGYNPSELKRNNDNLEMKVELSLLEALCGFKLVICQLDKRKLIINHEKTDYIIQSGQVMKIKGEGMPCINNPMEKGDLIIHFNIIMPKQLDNQRKDILFKVLPNVKRVNPEINNETDTVDETHKLEECTKEETHRQQHQHHQQHQQNQHQQFDEDDGGHFQPPQGVQCAQQ